ncbi:hypothetical protein ACED16_01335 [Enterobacter hormaechei]
MEINLLSLFFSGIDYARNVKNSKSCRMRIGQSPRNVRTNDGMSVTPITLREGNDLLAYCFRNIQEEKLRFQLHPVVTDEKIYMTSCLFFCDIDDNKEGHLYFLNNLQENPYLVAGTGGNQKRWAGRSPLVVHLMYTQLKERVKAMSPVLMGLTPITMFIVRLFSLGSGASDS